MKYMEATLSCFSRGKKSQLVQVQDWLDLRSEAEGIKYAK